MSYSQQQIDQLTEALNKFGEIEIPRGLIQDYGEKGALRQITEHMIQHGNVPPTVDGIKLTVQAFEKAGHKIYYAKYEWDYIQEYQQLSSEGQKVFNTFWNSPWVTGQLTTGSSKEGYENATKFLVWCHGRLVTKEYLQMAFSNLSAKGQLHFLPAAPHKFSEVAQKAGVDKQTEYKPGQAWNDSRVEQRKWEIEEAQRKVLAEKARNNPAAAADAEWESKWNNLQGNSYAQTSRAKAILILKNDGSPDYKSMYNAALIMMDESNRQPLDRY